MISMFFFYVGNVKYFTFENTKFEVTSLSLSFYSGLFAYNGWYVKKENNSINFLIKKKLLFTGTT